MDAGTMYANAKALHELLQESRAENAELRELVRDMWLHSYCSIAKTREDDDRHIEDVIDRMRELGVSDHD